MGLNKIKGISDCGIYYYLLIWKKRILSWVWKNVLNVRGYVKPQQTDKKYACAMYTIELLGLVIHQLLSTLLDQYLDLINT